MQVQPHMQFHARRPWWRTMALAVMALTLVLGAAVLAVSSLDHSSAQQVVSSNAASQIVTVGQPAQDAPRASVLPDALDRISWGAVLAGTVIALIVQLALNLLGISLGATALTPDYGDDSMEAKEIGIGAIVWVGLSTLIALFIGGWVAARFAGNPNDTDSLLHGLMVWGLTTLVSMLLLTTAIGRILSGTASLIGQGMMLTGQVAQATAQGVAGVAQGMAGMAQGMVGMAQSAAGPAQSLAQKAGDAVQNVVDDTPEVSMALRRFNGVIDQIQEEARQRLMQSTAPERADMQSRAETAVQEVQSTARRAMQDPEQARQQLMDTLQRMFRAGQGTISDQDRQQLIGMMTSQMNMSQDEARRMLRTWEDRFNSARQQFDQVRDQARQKAEQIRDQASQTVQQTKREVEQTAHDAARTTTKAVARLAGAVFAALVIGAFAAGVGGLIGSPDELPSVQVESQVPNTTLPGG